MNVRGFAGCVLLPLVFLAGARAWGANGESGAAAPVPAQKPAAAKAPVDVQTQAVLVKERAVIRRALQEPALRETYWFKRNHERGPDGLEEKLLEDVGVRAIPGTRLIEVFVECDNREDAAPIVNSVVKVYLEWAHDLLKSGVRTHLQTLYEEEAKLKRQLQVRVQELEARFADLTGMGLMHSAQRGGSQRLQELTGWLTRAELELALASEKRKRLEARPTGAAPATRPADAAAPGEGDSGLDAARKAEASARAMYQVVARQLEEARAAQKDLDRKITAFKIAEAEFLALQSFSNEVSDRRRRLQIMLGCPANLAIRSAADALPPLKPTPSGKWRASARIIVNELKPPDPMSD